MLYDFHTHTSLSDGDLSPIEMIRRGVSRGYHAIALTDHVAIGSLSRIINELLADCTIASKHWGITALPGVELTHVPAAAIAQVAKQAKELGARLVVVHGETPVEPVEKGTNLAAVRCPYVDILAHPGLLTLEEAKLAQANHIFLELSARKGHCLCNGHNARLAKLTGARLLVNSDAHQEDELLSPPLATVVARGAGLTDSERRLALTTNPRLLLEKLLLPKYT